MPKVTPSERNVPHIPSEKVIPSSDKEISPNTEKRHFNEVVPPHQPNSPSTPATPREKPDQGGGQGGGQGDDKKKDKDNNP
jgi:hypothetical protein